MTRQSFLLRILAVTFSVLLAGVIIWYRSANPARADTPASAATPPSQPPTLISSSKSYSGVVNVTSNQIQLATNTPADEKTPPTLMYSSKSAGGIVAPSDLSPSKPSTTTSQPATSTAPATKPAPNAPAQKGK